MLRHIPGAVYRHMATRRDTLAKIYAEGTRFTPHRGLRTVLKPNVVLYMHQEEDLEAMRGMERRGEVDVTDLYSGSRKRKAENVVLSNVGLVSEPPCTGTSVTVIAHLKCSGLLRPDTAFCIQQDTDERERDLGYVPVGHNAYRKLKTENGVAYPGLRYVGLDILVVPGRSFKSWQKQLVDFKIPHLATQARRNPLQDKPPEEWGTGLLLVHGSMYEKVARALIGYRVSRLVVDLPSSISNMCTEIKACFVWAIEPNLMELLERPARGKGFVRDVIGASLGWITDPTPFVIRHPLSAIFESMEVEYPAAAIYRSHALVDFGEHRLPSGSDTSTEIVTRMLVEYDIECTNKESMLCRQTEPNHRARIVSNLEDGCPICLSEDQPEVLLNCCKNLLCSRCACAIMSTTARCPFDKKSLGGRGSMAMLAEGVQRPLNVTHVYGDQVYLRNFGGTSRSTWLSYILHSVSEQGKVLIYMSDNEAYTFNDNLGIFSFLTQLGYIVYKARGNAQNVIQNAEAYQARVVTPQYRMYTNKTALLVSPGCNLSSVCLDATTDVVFFSKVGEDQYMSMMNRVLTPRRPMIDRDGGARLRVHFLMFERSWLPNNMLLTFRGEADLGKRNHELYDESIMKDVATFHVNPLRYTGLDIVL